MDGVLVESEEYINRAGVELFKEKGFEVDPDAFLPFTGMGENRYLGGVAEKYQIPFDLKTDKARAYEIYAELVKGNLEPLPGVKDFIGKCRSLGLKIAIATSADLTKMKINLEEIHLPADTFDAAVNGLEIKNLKPAPDIFLTAAKRIGVDPVNCLVVEDAVSGVKAGKSAGARVLAVTTTFSKEELSLADWTCRNLADAPEEALLW